MTRAIGRQASYGPPPFTVIHAGELHSSRRGPILARHPEIDALAGYDPRTVWVTLANVVAQFTFAWAIGAGARLGTWAGKAWFVIPFAYVVGATLTHWLSMTIHETSHDLACRTRRANRWLALLANAPMVIPCAMSFHRYHARHHAILGMYPDDTDLPHPSEVAAVGNSSIKKLLWLTFHFFGYLGREIVAAKKPNRSEVVNAGLMVAVDVAIVLAFGWMALGYLALCVVFAHSLHPVAAHFVHEHYTVADGQQTYSYYGPLNLVNFNVGYHNEHHDFPRVPGWRLPEIRRIAPESYASLVSHTSWTGVLWHFITSPRMSLAKRIVRTRDDAMPAKATNEATRAA
jgi:sphingolipid delta-4 desaturase